MKLRSAAAAPLVGLCLALTSLAGAYAAAPGAANPAVGRPDADELGRTLAHELFDIIDFPKLVAAGAANSLTKSDLLSDVRPEWPKLLMDSLNEEVQADQPVFEKMFGKIMTSTFTLEELQAGVIVMHDPKLRAMLIARMHNEAAPAQSGEPCGRDCMRIMSTPTGQSFMRKFGDIGNVLDKPVQREFAAVLMPGLFKRFGEKAQAAEAARGAP